MATDLIHVAIKTTTIEHEGQSWVVKEGETRLTSGHPAVKARPELFKPADVKPQKATPAKRVAK